jgi:hypothetical protein
LTALPCVSLSILALSDLEQGWLAFVAALGAVVALLVASPRDSVRWAIVVNLSACLALGWSLTERVPMTVSVQGDRLQARAGGPLVQARDSRYPEGGVAIWIDGANASRPTRARPERLDDASWLAWLLDPAYSGYRSGIAGLVVESDGSSVSATGPIWQQDMPVQQLISDEPFRSTSLRLDALRPLTPFAVLTRYTDAEGYQALARPESRDLSLSRVRDGRLVQELENSGSPFRKDLPAAMQSVLRELGRTWLFALALVAVGLVVSTLRLGGAQRFGVRARRAAFWDSPTQVRYI